MSAWPDYIAVPIKTITCCQKGCGLTFAVPKWWEEKRREDRTTWYCPNGHSQWFPGKTEAEKERSRREAAESRARFAEMRADREAASHRATKGHLTRAKKRAAAGVCPCCNRSFANVKRHMDSQHPEFATEHR